MLAVLLAMAMIVATVAATVVPAGAPAWPPLAPWVQPWARHPQVQTLAACLRDPAGVPPPPPGPEGRPANYLHTCAGRLYDSQGQEVRIFGINWSGMEYSDYAPHGLSERNWQEVLDQVAELGYNTIRVPFTNETLEPGRRVANVNWQLNPDLEGLTGLEMLDKVIAGARVRGLKVILDRHRPTPSSDNRIWYDDAVPEERWIADWRMLAARYKGNDTVIAVDLHNEPHGHATWGTGDLSTDWRLAAERAGSAVLEVNPHLLIFVEGVEVHDGHRFWWGGNLQGVRTHPVRLPVSNRIVYSPHDYGPNISWQDWFSDPRFPANLPAEWDRNWGYIQREGIAPVVVGEFGGHSVGNDYEGLWQRELLKYLRDTGTGAVVWSLNPSWDTGGVLASDWLTVDQVKQTAYSQLRAAPLAAGIEDVFGQAPGSVRVLFRQADAGQGEDVAFSFRVFNDTRQQLGLNDLEVRYWFKGADIAPEEADNLVAQAEIGGEGVIATIVPVRQGGQNHYLSLRFEPDAEPLAAYRATDSVSVRLRHLDRPEGAAMADYSFENGAQDQQQDQRRFAEWERVTLYRDGQLIWGVEPGGG